MKIVIISAVFPPEPVVSAKLSKDIATKLTEFGNVTVLSPKPSRPLGFNFRHESTNETYKHVVLDSFICAKSSLLGRFYESISFGFAITKYLSTIKEDIDVIYANTWPIFSQFLLVRYAQNRNITLVMHVQDVYPESLANKMPFLRRFLSFLFLPIDKYVLNNSSRVIAISDNMKNYLVRTRKLNEEKVFVILNWQNESEFVNIPVSNLTCEKDFFVYMYLGNIGPVAGVDLLIDAFTLEPIPKGKLIIAGSGSQKEYLQKKCIERRIENVEFMDVKDGCVSQVQNIADVLLLPIKKGAASSSIPSKLPAYMFSKKPIIACVDVDSDTANAINNANCGWVIEPDSAKLLSVKMLDAYLTSSEERFHMGNRGYNYAMLFFSKKINLNKIVSVIVK